MTVDGGAILTMPNFPILSEKVKSMWKSKL